MKNDVCSIKGIRCFCTFLMVTFVTFFVALVFSTNDAHAQYGSSEPHSFTYSQSFNPPPNFDCSSQNLPGHSPRVGILDNVFFKWHQLDQDISAIFDISRCPQNGNLANSFYLVLNAGANPKNHQGELAILYVDATDRANPILTVYGYIGTLGSWRDGIPVSYTHLTLPTKA